MNATAVARMGEIQAMCSFHSIPNSCQSEVSGSDRRRDLGYSVRSVVPEEFSRGRARLAIEATHTPDAIVKRLLAQPPEGLEVVPLRQDAEGVHLRLVDAAIDTPEPNRY